jgi:hypothetical protein
MNLTNPLGLGLLALAVPLVFAYLHRRHTEKHAVSSTILMRAIRDDQPSVKRARSKLRHRVSLAMILAALLLALLALVQPTSSAPPHRVVLVLDASASMGARDGDGDRLARARAAISTMMEGLSKRDEVALVAAGGQAGLLVPPTRTHADVLARIDTLAARGAGGDNRDDGLVFRLADGLCRDPAHTTLVVVSDGAGLATPPTRCPVAHLAIGTAADNLGIGALAVRSVDGMGVYDVHLAIASSAAAAKKVDVTFTTDGGAVVDVVPFDVPAGGDVAQTLRLTVEQGRTLTAALAGDDALALDDKATVALPDDGPVTVLLVTARPKSLLAEVLKLHPRVVLTVAAPTAIPAVPVDLVVLESEPAGPLPPSPHVVGFGVAPAGAPLSLGAAATQLAIVRWDFDAPWFRFVDLREVFITAARVVVGGTSIVDSGSGPLASSARWDDRELFVTGFTGDQTDLALRAAFPNLIANLVDWAAPRGATAPPPIGVLSAAESHTTPAELPGAVFAARAGWSDSGRLLRFALGIAAVLLLAEQLLTLRGRKKGTS